MSESLEMITKVNTNDIICGRKGVALKHPGNLAYRKIVAMNKELYATCMKNEKLRISKSIVSAMREAGGRFLEREDGKTSSSLEEKDDNGNPITYRDIGDKRAIEKTSQALREGQPKLLKKLAQKQQNAHSAAAAAASSQAQALQYQQAAMAMHPPPVDPLLAAARDPLVAAAMDPLMVAARGYSYNPYDLYMQPPIVPRSVAPQSVSPPPSGLLSPAMYSQLETDLLFLELLRRARSSGR